jgi:hypothetical protein
MELTEQQDLRALAEHLALKAYKVFKEIRDRRAFKVK